MPGLAVLVAGGGGRGGGRLRVAQAAAGAASDVAGPLTALHGQARNTRMQNLPDLATMGLHGTIM